jgi:hypothetical protein
MSEAKGASSDRGAAFPPARAWSSRAAEGRAEDLLMSSGIGQAEGDVTKMTPRPGPPAVRSAQRCSIHSSTGGVVLTHRMATRPMRGT